VRGAGSPDSTGRPRWEQRFRAPTVGFPRWARHAPDRLVVASNASGAWQVYAWDAGAGARRQVTDDPIGVPGGTITPDGELVVWFADPTGDEVGHWRCQPFPGGEDRPLPPGVPDAWTTGLAVQGRGGTRLTAVGTAGGPAAEPPGGPAAEPPGYTVWVAEGEGQARVLHRHPEPVGVAGLSADGRLLALTHAEHGDAIHEAVRVLDARSGHVAGDCWDGPGLGLGVAGWSPVEGDERLALVHERQGRDRPAVWDLATGERRDLAVDLPGEVDVAGWWPDGSALLLVHTHEGRDELWRLELVGGALERLPHEPGTLAGAGVRPDGDVWFRHTSGATPPVVRSLARGAEVVGPELDGQPLPPAPGGVAHRSWWFTNGEGDRIHGFVAEPDGPRPHPVVMLVHGGPTWAYRDAFMPDVQAWVDHGFTVGMVNYRGSTGYGVAFRDRLVGDPGFPEVADVVAGLDDLVASGVADPDRAVVAGGSWGGYVTLLAIGRHPDRWAAAVAAVPVADYLTAYADEAPGLQAFDRSLFGGEPATAGDLYRERSPLTYVGAVATPVLVLAGDNDSRCPIDQVLNYVAALGTGGVDHELYRFDAGHGSMVTEERVRQMAAELAFVTSRLRPPPT